MELLTSNYIANAHIESGRLKPNVIQNNPQIDRGIEVHNRISKFFVDLFGSGTVQANINGKNYYLNKGSCYKLLHVSKKDAPADLIAAINAVFNKDNEVSKEISIKINPLNSPEVSQSTYKFGKKEWAKYYGDIGEEPPLPSNIEKILDTQSDLYQGKMIREAYNLVLVPKTLNGKELDLDLLSEIAKNPKQGHKTQLINKISSSPNVRDPTPVTESHWVLMAKKIVPQSENESVSRVINHRKDCIEPPLRDAAIAILMEFVSSGTKLLPEYGTYTIEGCRLGSLIVGPFTDEGLILNECRHGPRKEAGLAPLKLIVD